MPNIRPLSEGLALRARNEFAEIPERIDEDLAALREWIERQPQLKAHTDDQFLVAFLRGCKFSIQKAKYKVYNFFTMRASIPEIYRNRFVGERQLNILRLGTSLRLPKPFGDDGPRIQMSRYGAYDPNVYTLAEVAQVSTMIGEIQIREDDHGMVVGFIEIIDLKGIGTGQLLQFDPMLVKRLAMMGDKAWPYRPKGLHFINVPAAAETVMCIARNLMSPKIKQRFHIHRTWEALYEHVPKKYLPIEYGGQNGSIAEITAYWERKLLEYKQFFEEEVNYGNTETGQSDAAGYDTDIQFGVAGSFRKLAID